MTDKTMEKRLAEALAKTAPNDIHGVLSRCKERKETKITETTKRHSRKWIGAVAACLAVLLLGGGGILTEVFLGGILGLLDHTHISLLEVIQRGEVHPELAILPFAGNTQAQAIFKYEKVVRQL